MGLCPTPRHLLKKVDENFSRMGLYKCRVILFSSRKTATQKRKRAFFVCDDGLR